MKMVNLLMVVCLLCVVGFAFAEPEKTHDYAGLTKCKMCHKPAYTHWAESKHALAFKTLGSDEAKKIAKAKGIEDPQKSDKCLKCHTTGFGATGKIEPENGVTCESCHGAGKDYATKKIMQSLEESKKAGMIVPDEKTCVKCHNNESPTFKAFDFKTFFGKIAHKEKK